MCREVIQSEWYQERWPLPLTKEADGEFLNAQGGGRISTSPTSKGIGLHGHRILIDDAMDATAADATSKTKLKETNDWYDSTIPGRMADPQKTAIVNIQQRLHENDLAGHLLEIEDWTVLCLPERFEAGHDFAWRGERIHPAVKERAQGTPLENGDPRRKSGEHSGDLLWPAHRGEAASNLFARTLRPHRAAGQLQQRPASREGEIIQRSWWRFYDQTIRTKDEWHRMPKKFSRIVLSVDCPLKDKQSNDCFAMQLWGVSAGDRFLLDLAMDQMNYNKAKRLVKEMAIWARARWPKIPHHILIENAGYGAEMIIDLKSELGGIVKLSHSSEGDKEVRADAAADSLESGNQYLPGIGPPEHAHFNEHATSADIVKFVDNLANFPHATFDDDVDAWSQGMNWLRGKQMKKTRVHTAASAAR
jgi:predicted phage terminase large subunit-like protein